MVKEWISRMDIPYQASKDWNNLDNDIENVKSLSFFKAKLKSL